MNVAKRCWYILATVAFASCNNNNSAPIAPPSHSTLKPIVVMPLEFDKEEKINWVDTAMPEQPAVSRIDINNLPATPYGAPDFKPFSKPVEERRFDYDSLPGKDLDLSKLATKPLKFDTCLLGPPKSIIAGSLHLKTMNNAALFEMGEAQGLEGNRVTCLLTDRDGFLWIATVQGVYRYDGQNLLQFIPGPTEYFIFSMLQDKSGQIWMGTQNGGVLVLEPQTGLIKGLSKKQGLSHINVGRMMCDDQQRIWVTTFGGGVNIIDPQKQTIKILNEAQGLSDTTAVDITQDINHNIWISTFSKGADLIDLKNRKIRYLNKTNGLEKDSLTSILADHHNRIWIAPYPGGELTVINCKNKSIQYIKDSQGSNTAVWTLMKDNRDSMWAGTSSMGVQVIDLDNRKIKKIHTTGDLYGDANGDFVEKIVQDNRGQIWVATRNGLDVIKENNTITNRIATSSAACLLEDHNGIIWEGTVAEGVKIVDRKKQLSRQLTIAQGLQSNNVRIIKEINGEIFICTNSGLDIVSSDRKAIRHLNNIHKENSVTANFITFEQERTVPNVISDQTGELWIGSSRLYIIDLKKGLARFMKLRRNDYANDLLQDNQGNVWISTVLNGINVINTQNGTIKYLKSNPGLETGFKVLLKDNEGNIWIGTSKGIYIADVGNNKLGFFSVQQGLIGEGVTSLLKYNDRIYAGTRNGITVITPGTRNITSKKEWGVESFGMDYGLTKATTDYYNTDLITKDGLYWWRGDGITLLNLASKDAFKPQCYITGVSLRDEQKSFMNPARTNLIAYTRWGQNKPRYYKNIKGSPDSAYLPNNKLNWQNLAGPYNMPVNLTLSYDQNFIQFQYASPNLISGHNTYRYILEPSDKKWSNITPLTSSRHYFSLKAGQYTFKVIALGLNGKWSDAAQLSFTIKSPWWETWWAFLLYVQLFVGVTWCVVHFRSLQLLKDKRLLENEISTLAHEVTQQKEEIATQKDDLESQRADIEKAHSIIKTTQAQLIQREKMASIGELTAGIANEIQNPLNVVNNSSEVNAKIIEDLEGELKTGNVQEALAITADIKENEKKINLHGKQADAIVKEMLQHSRVSKGERQLTDLNALADEFFKLSFHGLRAKDESFIAEMVTDFDPHLPKLNVVQQDIGYALLNMFNNAFYTVNQKVKTAGPGYKPQVSVSTSSKNDQIVIKIKDNGNGIPDSIKDKIMQLFFTTKPAGEGTGLGLSLSYDIIVNGHGGNLKVYSIESKGSEFIIQLPIN